jgi:hypothetical protein
MLGRVRESEKDRLVVSSEVSLGLGVPDAIVSEITSVGFVCERDSVVVRDSASVMVDDGVPFEAVPDTLGEREYV